MTQPTKPAPKKPTPTSGPAPAEELKSPLKPLLWLLIPLVAVLIYGFFN
jgi:hypothetical protein